MTIRPSNPFSTRFTAPGKVEWISCDSISLDELELRWQRSKRRCAIVGAHGAGKSTLLEHLVPRLVEIVWRRDAAGNESGKLPATLRKTRAGIWLQLRRIEPRSMLIPWKRLRKGDLLILDGYEQFGYWYRTIVLARTWLKGVETLVTSHRRAFLPTLCELSVSPQTARKVVCRLMVDHEISAVINEIDMESSLTAHRGNMREVLMGLYDQFEIQQTKAAGTPCQQ